MGQEPDPPARQNQPPPGHPLMSFRINTNTQAALSLSSLSKTSNEIGMRQMRLSTGSKINSAADDSAGFTISNKLQATTRGQAQALSNIGDAKSMMTVAEGALGSTMDILQTMKEKAVQAGNSSMGAEERAAIQSQVEALSAEVSDILGTANFNGTKLFSDSAETALSFQVGAGASDRFGADIKQMGVSTLGIGTVAAADVAAVEAADASATLGAITDASNDSTPPAVAGFDGSGFSGASDTNYTFTVNGAGDELSYTDAAGDAQTIAISGGAASVSADGIAFDLSGLAAGDTIEVAATAAVEAQAAVKAGDFEASALDLTTDEGVAAALNTIDAAIKSVNETAAGLGDVQNRLDFKSQNLETSMNNYEAANSRIADADFAKEQMEIVKLQILQQTGSAMFAQSNAAPQSVLSFF